MSELEVLTPIGKELVLQNKKITILPFKFTQFSIVSKLIQQIRSKVSDGDIRLAADEDGAQNFNIDFLKLVAECSEEVFQLCSLAAKVDREFLDTLDGDEGIVLVVTVFEVNKDFFIQKILPQFSKIVGRLG